MSHSLVAVALGPVQGFIASARRTRDFWMGSAILAECVRSVAHRVGSTLGLQALVFPAPQSLSALEPMQFDHARQALDVKYDVSNVIVFETPDGTDLRAFTGELKDAVIARWRKMADAAEARCLTELERDRCEQQRDDCPIEFYAAWVRLEDRTYADARNHVMRILAGRKACRDFSPHVGPRGVPKSSLDGTRETVLRPDHGKRRRRGLHVRPNEHLDLVGVVKRADWGGDSIRYPSVSRVAADPWIRGVSVLAQTIPEVSVQVEVIREAARMSGARERYRHARLGIEHDLKKFPWLTGFPFEGSPLYSSRHTEVAEQIVEDMTPDDEDGWDQALVEVRLELQKITTAQSVLRKKHRVPEPSPYLALIAADGDGIGRVLSDIARTGNADTHREFTRRQATFSSGLKAILNQRFSGACVFAGADDVLGFVAVDQALECAEALRAHFKAGVSDYVRSLGVEPPTMSIGIAIGHFMDPLEDLLEYVRVAEKRSKNPSKEDLARKQKSRDGFAVAVHARSGAPFIIRDNWTTSSGPTIAERLRIFIDGHVTGAIPSKAAYDLLSVSRRHAGSTSAATHIDALRVLSRKEGGGAGFGVVARVASMLAVFPGADGIAALSRELLVAQWIAEARRQVYAGREVPLLEPAVEVG